MICRFVLFIILLISTSADASEKLSPGELTLDTDASAILLSPENAYGLKINYMAKAIAGLGNQGDSNVFTFWLVVNVQAQDILTGFMSEVTAAEFPVPDSVKHGIAESVTIYTSRPSGSTGLSPMPIS